MASRTVTFTSHDLNDSPIEGEVFVFKLLEWGTATDAPIYLKRGVKADPTDVNGESSIDLWVNGDSEKTAVYRVMYPTGESEEFIIPAGGGSIDLSDLVINYNPDAVDPQAANQFALKADRDAGNIGTAQATSWRTALSVESASELDARDAADRDRANHTGTQLSSTISDFVSAVAARISAAVGSVVQAWSTNLDELAARTSWNNTDKTFNITTGLGGVVVQVGQEVVVRCRNATGSTIANGSVVRVSGATGNRPTIALAQADAIANATGLIGLTTAQIANNADGFVTVIGTVRGLDTSAYAEGVDLYLSAASAGGLTAVEPAIGVEVGTVTRSHASLGTIDVHINTHIENYRLASSPTTVGGFDSAAWASALSSDLLPFIAPSNTIFVAKNGTDTRTGLSPNDLSNPFLTVNAAEDAATVEGVVMSGAGTTSQNATYESSSSFVNGKQEYTVEGGPATTRIYWSSADSKWYQETASGIYYQSTDDTTYPWEATWAVATLGVANAPTATRRPASTIVVFPGGYSDEAALTGVDGVCYYGLDGATLPAFEITTDITIHGRGTCQYLEVNGAVSVYFKHMNSVERVTAADNILVDFGSVGSYFEQYNGNVRLYGDRQIHDGTTQSPIYLFGGDLSIYGSRIESTEIGGPVIDIGNTWGGSLLVFECDIVNTTANSKGILYGTSATGDVQIRGGSIITGTGGVSIDAPSAQSPTIQGTLNVTHDIDTDITPIGGSIIVNPNFTA